MSTAQAALQLVATAVVVASCQQPAPPGAPTSGTPAGATVTAAPVASAPPQPMPSSSAAPPVSVSVAAHARIPCGRGSCPAATQICCGHVPKERGTCMDYTGDRTDISALGRACRGIDDEHYPLVCDDSGDCPAGHTCCDELGGDPDYHICTPLRDDGWHACNGFEVCGADVSCRTAGTSCENGVCTPPRPNPDQVRIPCRGLTCTGAQPICCAGAGPGRARCAADARDCPDYTPVIPCAGANDCAPRESCLLIPPAERPDWWRTQCSQWHGGGNLAVVCRTDADCPRFGGLRLVCQPNEDFPLLHTCTNP